MNEHLPMNKPDGDDGQTPPSHQPPETQEKPAFPDRRSVFRLLGIALVWYYVYQLVSSLIAGEIDAGERRLIILFIVLMAGANLWLTIKVGTEQWKAYKAGKKGKDTSDT
ncbi:MAG TPA: hypothetical protein GXZ64_09675 [Clostridiaceae bacterium]|nr:hypothetical protein [Clostridiaceae bacterium]